MENDNSRQNMERGIKNKAKDGTYYWIEPTITLLSMNKEDRISMLQFDITERKSRNES
jgi:hypothetical protein